MLNYCIFYINTTLAIARLPGFKELPENEYFTKNDCRESYYWTFLTQRTQRATQRTTESGLSET